MLKFGLLRLWTDTFIFFGPNQESQDAGGGGRRQRQDPLLTLRCTWKLLSAATFQASGLRDTYTWFHSQAAAQNPAWETGLFVLHALPEPAHGGASPS